MPSDFGTNDIFAAIDTVSILSKYQLKIDIWYQNKYVTLQTISADNIKSQPLPLDEFLYLVETGSIAAPGKFVIEHILQWAAAQEDQTISKILDNIFEKNWKEPEIDLEFQQLESRINSYIFTYFSNYYQSQTLFAETNAEILFDPDLFKKYLRCKIYKNK